MKLINDCKHFYCVWQRLWTFKPCYFFGQFWPLLEATKFFETNGILGKIVLSWKPTQHDMWVEHNSIKLTKYICRYTCLNYQKFVLKSEAALGIASQILDNLVFTCLVSGWFNDTSGAYTCTRNCSNPTEMIKIMKHNEVKLAKPGVVSYGTVYK